MIRPSTAEIAEQLAHAPRAEPIRLPGPGRPWTIAELEALSGDDYRYELVRGDLMIASPASPIQGRYAVRLIHALVDFVDEHDLGEVYTAEPGFILKPEPEAIVRAPDVAFVRKDRIPPPDEQTGFWPVAPDLAVEIVSPSDRADEIEAKVRDYLTFGVRLAWVVYPSKQVIVEHRSLAEACHLGLDDELAGGEVLPGFTHPLRQLFR
ncbi:MAG: Uma2 family endonuclease [Chloroflexi bacterium]|nr:Uma2 family endonuclease [Chloroflexota bacterium]